MAKKKGRKKKTEFEKRLRLRAYNQKYIVGRVTDEEYVRRTFREWVYGLDFSDLEATYIVYHFSVSDNFLFVRGMNAGEQGVLRWVLRKNTVTVADLEKLAREYAWRYWGREFDLPIEVVSAYWKNRYGAYAHKRDGTPVSIVFSEKRMYKMTVEKIEDTLLHELVHWHLHTTGQPYDDRDEAFILECRRVGASLSGAKYAQDAAKRLDRRSGS